MKVVSLFDGMACGLTALKRAGIKVSEYHAFEMDKHAIQIAKKNHPEIIHHGIITADTDFKQFADIGLLIGVSPCQGFSFAGKQLNFNDPRSSLFFEFVRAKKEIQPRNFLLENVKMKKEYLDIISEKMGVDPILINSSLVSAQNRNRYYWCDWETNLPEDKNIQAIDIIVKEDKSVNTDGWYKWWNRKAEYQLNKKYSCFINEEKKGLCMVARQISNWNGNLVKHNKGIRFISPIEAERLQNLPDNYTDGVAKGHRYKMLGNGWTIDVITDLFKQGNLQNG